jgi:hypothetical protein
VAIVFPADPELRRKTRLEDSRFARTAAALAEKGIAVEGTPYVADDVEGLREQLRRLRTIAESRSVDCGGVTQGVGIPG